MQTLDQDENEEFPNLVKELADDFDLDDYVNFGKDIASSISAVDVGSISWRQEIWKEITEKHENPVEDVTDLTSNEDVDEEIEDPKRIKSASDAL